MPPFNREPRMYQGYIISLIGQSAGSRVDMEFKNAQACVSSGTHRWADDETDISPALQSQIDDRAKLEEANRESDAIHNQRMREMGMMPNQIDDKGKIVLPTGGATGVTGPSGTSVADTLAAQAQAIHIIKVGDSLYLARPFPQVAAITTDLLYWGDGIVEEITDGDGDDVEVGDILITFENGVARYRPMDGNKDDDMVVAMLMQKEEPEVDIPADWREMSHLQTIPMAKLIRGGSKDSMKKPDAMAIIEEWIKTDDQILPEGSGEQPITDPRDPNHPEAGNRDKEGFKDEHGNSITAEEKARLDAEKFAGGDDFGD